MAAYSQSIIHSRHDQMFPTLLPAQIDRLREFGIVRTFATGETLAKVGEISQGFAITDGQDRGVIGTQTWRLADLGSKHMLLKEGIGWGYMPEPMVRTDIEKGGSCGSTCPSTRTALSGCTRSTEPIPLQALRVPGSLPGSWLRPKRLPKLTINAPARKISITVPWGRRVRQADY
jgi:hypothetical protein